jgi:dCTP deaminase
VLVSDISIERALDLRLGEIEDDNWTIPPLSMRLASTYEWVELPSDMAGFVCVRSTAARQRLAQTFTLIDPGFVGNIVLELANFGPRSILLERGGSIVQMVLHRTDRPVRRVYGRNGRGRYQGQRGVTAARPEVAHA